MKGKTLANIAGVVVFVTSVVGVNLVIEFTSLRAFVVFTFSMFLAAYIADKVDPV